MRAAGRGLVAIGMVVLLCGVCSATQIDVSVSFPNSGQVSGDYAWNPADAVLSLSEQMKGTGNGVVDLNAVTSEDPTFTVVKSVQNQTDFVWTSYQIELTNAGGTTFANTPSSIGFANVTRTDTLLTFDGASIAPGQTATFTFDINIPSGGSFAFGLNQTAVPEPATMALLMAGAGLAIARRKSRRA